MAIGREGLIRGMDNCMKVRPTSMALGRDGWVEPPCPEVAYLIMAEGKGLLPSLPVCVTSWEQLVSH